LGSRTSPIELTGVLFRLVLVTNLRGRMRADPPDLAREEYAGDVAVLLASGAKQGDGSRGPLGGLDEGLHGLGWRHLRDGPDIGGKRKELLGQPRRSCGLGPFGKPRWSSWSDRVHHPPVGLLSQKHRGFGP